MPKIEKVRLMTRNERIISMEEWEELEELFQDCLQRRIPFSLTYDTGRYSEMDSSEVKQGEEGWLLEIGGYAIDLDGGHQKHYGSLTELIADGWDILKVIAQQDYLDLLDEIEL